MFALTLSLLAGCGAGDVQTDAPSTVTTVMNTSGDSWTGMSVLVDGKPACTVAELAPNGSVTIQDGACEIVNPEVATEAVVEEAAEAPSNTSGGAAPAAGATEEAPPPLKLVAKVTGGIGPARAVRVQNTGNFDWTGCRVTLNGTWSYSIATIAAGTSDATPLAKFKNSDGDMMTSNSQITKVRASCKQGTATVSPS